MLPTFFHCRNRHPENGGVTEVCERYVAPFLPPPLFFVKKKKITSRNEIYISFFYFKAVDEYVLNLHLLFFSLSLSLPALSSLKHEFLPFCQFLLLPRIKDFFFAEIFPIPF